MMITTEDVARRVAPRSTCAYDMLRRTMREMYYRLIQDGQRPTRMTSGVDALCGYEMLCEQNDAPMTTFKDLVVSFDRTLAPDVMRFYQNETLVGEIANIS